MKANFIISKKQIILASLVIVLGVAVYLNWTFANKELGSTDTLKNTSAPGLQQVLDNQTGLPVANDDVNTDDADNKEKTKTDKTKLLGDAKLVNAKTIADDTYFVKARLARANSRDQAIETISTILEDEKLTEADKKTASQKAMSITDIIEAETRIENLVKAKGFEDCMVYLSDNNASVVVKTDGLDQDKATQIKNIIVKEGSIKGENVSISEVK